jgi:hypothetical protein
MPYKKRHLLSDFEKRELDELISTSMSLKFFEEKLNLFNQINSNSADFVINVTVGCFFLLIQINLMNMLY